MTKVLFKSTWKKHKALVIFTIHTVKLPHTFEDAFQIEWSRGGTKGMTEQVFLDEQGELVFEKRFRVNTTFCINVKENTIRPKNIHFTLKRVILKNPLQDAHNNSSNNNNSGNLANMHIINNLNNNNNNNNINNMVNGMEICENTQPKTEKKTYGKLQLDFANFYNMKTDSPLTSLFQLESPYATKSFMLLSVQVSLFENGSPLGIQKSGENNNIMNRASNSTPNPLTDYNLTSTSDSMMMTSENDDEWDKTDPLQFSTSTQNNSKNNNDFLSPFLNKSSAQRQRIRLSTQDDFDLSDTGKTREQKLSKFLSKKPQKVKLTQQGTINFLKSVLMEEWERGPLQVENFPKSSAVIYAALLQTQVLEEGKFTISAFDQIASQFSSKYEMFRFIKSESCFDTFISSLFLLCLIKTDVSQLNSELRINRFTEMITKFAINQLDQLIFAKFPPFIELINSLLSAISDAETLLSSFSKEYKLFLSSFDNQCSEITSFIVNRFFAVFDTHLLNAVVSLPPQNLTFSNSIVWNSFAARLFNEGSGGEKKSFKIKEEPVPLFKEAAAVLQMSKQICQNPKCVSDVCPCLPKIVILTLLKLQKNDEYHPTQNDVSAFVQYFSINEKETATGCEVAQCEGIEELVASLRYDNWSDFSFDQQTGRVFPFLHDYFHVV